MSEHSQQTTSEKPQTTSVAQSLLPPTGVDKGGLNSEQAFRIQPKLSIGSPDDPYEREADDVANRVMRMPSTPFSPSQSAYGIQMKCAACAHQEEEVHRKVSETTPFIQKSGLSGGMQASDSVSSEIAATRGAGSPLAEGPKSFMESRFGMDFGSVRIHDNSTSSQLSERLNAQAFTVGSDIYFNSGKYQPDSDSGKQLLAHELTHTIQQNQGDIKPKIQRQAYWVGIKEGGKKMTGTHIHNTVLKEFGNKNSDLFTEAPVPNATLKSAEYGKEGSADMYLASTTVGVKFNAHHTPAYLDNNRKLRKGNKPFKHGNLAAPTVKNGVVDLNGAPSSIKVGDLKPYGAPLSDPEYQEQISAYLAGFKMVKNEINEMAQDPSQRYYLKPEGGVWHPTISEMTSADAQVPDQYVLSSTSAPLHRIVLKQGGKTYFDKHIVVMGRMHIAYRKDQKGIWNYIWVPEAGQNITAASLPATVVAQQININHLVDPLSDVHIQTKPKATGARPRIQRKKDASGFDFEKWKADHTKFRSDYKAVPEADKEEASAKALSFKVGKEMYTHFGRIPGFETGLDSPKEVEHVKLVKKLKFWSNPLSVIVGWLREKFGGTFVKIHKAVVKIKQKVKQVVAKTKATISKGGIVGSVIKVFIKAFKMLGVYLVTRTVDLITQAITSGFQKKVSAFVESLIPDEVETEIEKLNKIKDDYEKRALETVDELLERFVGKNLKDFEDLAEVAKIAQTATSIISLVRWGARLLACASPPALGCLWIIAEAVLEEVAARVIESCWFIKKVIPKIAVFDIVASIPNKIANHVIEQANLVMPTGWNDTFEKVPESALGYDGNYRVDCSDGGGSGEPFGEKRQEVIELMEALGEERFVALMELLSKRGAGPWALLDSERVNMLKNSAIATLDPETLRQIAKDPTKDTPVELEELLKSVAQYSKKEKETKAKYFRDKAKRALLAEGGGSGARKDGSEAGTGKSEAGKGTPYQVIKTPIPFDKSTHRTAHITELNIKAPKDKVRTNGEYEASVQVTINGTLVVVPSFKIKVLNIMQILTVGEAAPYEYNITITEDVFIKFSTGETLKLNGMNISETFIRFAGSPLP
ncbi:uncharacterized protein DUF4157 [Dyadobacter jejuensis]|uniref:Uncharacterized protein DUF4157 n=1 Tax=Dyadobacter jejuensis TaxID=1082580 RepID=A0A316AIF1_9BACT|nr:DUF4157 domain-containing protein [Dyadobacter jejuensis]PWJ57483.1 uncharacterized protein DUF4157 [Dyadobacter jejuensis]